MGRVNYCYFVVIVVSCVEIVLGGKMRRINDISNSLQGLDTNYYYRSTNHDRNGGGSGVKRVSTYNYPKKKNVGVVEVRVEKIEEKADEETNKVVSSKTNLPRKPGLPNDIPLPTINMSNVVALIELLGDEGVDPEDLTFEQEALIIQTLSQVANLVGLQDVRDWIGMIAMFFVLGPIVVPLFMFPITLIIMGSFLIPLVVNGASVAAAVAAAEGGVGLVAVGRKGGSYGGEESYCGEMIWCEVGNWMRRSRMSDWVTRAFSLTAVEWAGPMSPKSDDGYSFTREEDCGKYRCKIVTPLQGWLNEWYPYLFTYQNNTKRPGKRGKVCGRKFKRRCTNEGSTGGGSGS